MATMRQQTKMDENEVGERQRVGNKIQTGEGRGARKALGDIGNLVGPFNTRCNVGKENIGGKADGNQQTTKVGVMTRRSAAAAGVVINEAVLGWKGQKARNSLKTKEADLTSKEQTIGSRNSLTGLLVSRSEDAVASQQQETPSSPIPDIDSADHANPLAASEYAGDIFAYYRRVEPIFQTPPTYMESQADINEKMRAILIDWLVEVHLKFKLMPETLFLTTDLIDRFLSKQQVTRKHLQLVGVTAMLIASKYEEIWAPEVRDFVYISDRAYTKEQILAMEKKILNTLSFDLTVPTPNTFLCRFLKASGHSSDRVLAMLAAYLVELALVEYQMLRFPYSQIAAAAVLVAGKLLSLDSSYARGLHKHSSYAPADLKTCASALEKLRSRAPTSSLFAVYKKYSGPKFLEVATRLPGLAGPAP